MATIKEHLGYPEATVMFGAAGVFVAVVDKSAADRVVWKAIPTGEGVVPDRFARILALVDAERMDPEVKQVALLYYGWFCSMGAEATLDALDLGGDQAASVTEVWEALATRRSTEDFVLALWTLDHNPNPDARRAALWVMGNFLEYDAAWWSIADSLRDPVESVRGTALSALHSALKRAPRLVDWKPAARTLAHVLNGTNLSALHVTAKALVATEVAPALRRDLLLPGAHALLDYACARTDFAHAAARQLLERLTGAAHGRDRAAWQAEISRQQ